MPLPRDRGQRERPVVRAHDRKLAAIAAQGIDARSGVGPIATAWGAGARGGARQMTQGPAGGAAGQEAGQPGGLADEGDEDDKGEEEDAS